MTIIESFACSTAIIGSNHSGFLELIEDEKNGFVVDFTANNFEKVLLSKILQYKKSFNKYARESYANHYTKDVHVPKIISIYTKVLNESI